MYMCHAIQYYDLVIHLLPGQSMYAPRLNACLLIHSTSFVNCLIVMPSLFWTKTAAISDQGEITMCFKCLMTTSYPRVCKRFVSSLERLAMYLSPKESYQLNHANKLPHIQYHAENVQISAFSIFQITELKNQILIQR